VNPKKIWIDLGNTHYVRFFMPILEEVHVRGYKFVLTAPDSYQACQLLDLHGVSSKVVGRHSGKSRILKKAGRRFRATLEWIVECIISIAETQSLPSCLLAPTSAQRSCG
jgi:predicted glycosyltransferase